MSDVNVVVDYFRVESPETVYLESVLFQIVKEKDRTCVCNGRVLLLSDCQSILSNGEKVVFARMLRVRHASYPVLVDGAGREVAGITCGEGQCLAEPSAFLYSQRKKLLLLLQNKSGVRQTCIAAYLSHFAQKYGNSATVRLPHLVDENYASELPEDVKKVHGTIQYFIPNGSAACDRMSVGGRIDHERAKSPHLTKSVNLKVKAGTDAGIVGKLMAWRLDGRGPDNFSLDWYNDFEVSDLFKNPFCFCQKYSSSLAKRMNADDQKKILNDAWSFGPFKENFLRE